MADNSVGVISLDLVIKDRISSQLETIRQAASAPAERVGGAIEAAIGKPVQRVSGALSDSIGSAAEKASRNIRESIDSALDGTAERADELSRRIGDINIHFGTDISEVSGQLEETVRNAEGMGDIRIHFHTDIADVCDSVNSALDDLRARADIRVNVDMPDISGIAEQAESAAQTVRDSIGNALDSVREQAENSIDIPVNADIPDIGSQLESAVNDIDTTAVEERINSTMSNIREMLGNAELSSDPAERLVKELELTEEKISIVHARWQELQSDLAADTQGTDVGKITEGMNRAEAEMLRLAERADKVRGRLEELSRQDIDINADIRADTGSLEEAERSAERLRISASDAFGKILSAGKKAFTFLGKVGTRSLDSLRQRFGFVGKTASAMSRPVEKLGRTIKNTFRRVFITATLFAAVRALKSAFADIMKQNAELSDSLNQVKANLAAAFMPIMQIVMPALNTFMHGLAAVTKQVAGFISGLFGTTYAQSAKAAQKLKDTAKTAQDTAKKVKAAMAGIDEMNVLSTGSDSADADKDDEQTGIDWSKVDMSEPVLPDWAERLKTAIKTGDWQGAGEIFAERVNAVFSRIDWDRISGKINSGIQGVVDVINGFVGKVDWELLGDSVAGGINTVASAVNTFWDGVDWDSLGRGLAQGLNRAVKKINWRVLGKSLTGKLKALIDTLYAFTSEFDFSALGTGVGEAVNGAFDNIDFAKAGQTFSNSIKGLLDFLISFVETVDWGSIGRKIYQFMSNIDYAGIASRVFELLGAALGASVSLLWGFLSDIVEKIQKHFEDEFARMDTGNIGADIILGILVGIGDAVIGIGKWIYDNVLTPFINGFKKAFDIHSPSKVMAKMGGYIIEGLFGAISDGIAEIKKIFEKMRDTVTGVFDKTDEWFRKKFSDAWTKIKNVFSGAGVWFGQRWSDIKGVFSLVGTWFSEKFTEAWKGIETAFSGCKKFFTDRRDEVHSAFGDMGEWFGKRWDDVKDKFSGVKDYFKDTFKKGYDSITEVFGGLGDFFYHVWEDVSDKARHGMNWFMGAIENSLNHAIDFLNRWGFELPSGDWFGLAIGHVELPRLASGGIATAPTLAMVGDNRNASVDPEVIAPLSKLKGMTGSDPETVEILRMILELLRSGMNIEIVNYMFRNSREFSREVLNVIAEDNARKGQ